MIELFVLYITLGSLLAGCSLLDGEYWDNTEDTQGFGYWDWLGLFFTGVAVWPLFIYWYLMPDDDN